jgi:hypothetical protein
VTDTPYPTDVANVQEGLAALSQRGHLVTMDELMSRRHHNHRDLKFQVSVWRRERLAWRDARDKIADKREEAEDA